MAYDILLFAEKKKQKRCSASRKTVRPRVFREAELRGFGGWPPKITDQQVYLELGFIFGVAFKAIDDSWALRLVVRVIAVVNHACGDIWG
jgi:hypothetical protein